MPKSQHRKRAAHPQVRGLHSRTARALAESLPRLPSYTAAGPAARERFMALMRGPQALPPLIEDCFSLLQAALR